MGTSPEKCNFAFLRSFLGYSKKFVVRCWRSSHNCKTGHFMSWKGRKRLRNVQNRTLQEQNICLSNGRLFPHLKTRGVGRSRDSYANPRRIRGMAYPHVQIRLLNMKTRKKNSRGTELRSYFNFYSLDNMWQDQLYRISGSEFYEWLFGPVKFSGLSRNETLKRRRHKSAYLTMEESSFCTSDFHVWHIS